MGNSVLLASPRAVDAGCSAADLSNAVTMFRPLPAVSRFRRSYHFAARSPTNVGTKGTLQLYDSSAAVGFDVPIVDSPQC